jgi:hypothetical protein
MTAQEAEGGVVLRDSDGNFFFVRDSGLELLRVQGVGLDRLQQVLGTETAKPSPAPLQVVGRLETAELTSVAAQEPDDASARSELLPSTVMCPWFC